MLRLRDIMTTGVITVTPETPLRAAMDLFAEHHISGMPVVEGTRVVGVLSASDVLAFAATPPGEREEPEVTLGDEEGEERDERAVALDTDEWEEPPGVAGDAEQAGRNLAELWMALGGGEETEEPRPRAPGWDPLAEATVADAMTWGVYALPPASDVAAAAECMRSADVHRMLVMEQGRLLGIVTTMDLVRAVAGNRILRRTYVFDRP